MPWLHDSTRHPRLTRRVAIQAGAVGLLGLGMNHVAGLQAIAAAGSGEVSLRRKSVIYIFLSGGLGQHDSFDPKPEAPDTIRGEFAPIATQTAGIQICEHLPMLAACSGLSPRGIQPVETGPRDVGPTADTRLPHTERV